MMRLLAMLAIAALLLTGLYLCHRGDVEDLRRDYQAYQRKSLLPEEYLPEDRP